jgi:aryl-alcohol dehydrogenase-like predicted oxidoreductase
MFPNNQTIDNFPTPMKRKFGKNEFQVTTLALGGQASIQWTPDDIDPTAIILKAFKLGINYFDTSNLYDDSQLNFNKAFKKLNLIPGTKNYDKTLRESIWLTSKTGMRWGKPYWPTKQNVRNISNGKNVQCAVDDVRRSLTQIFGDGKGNYPEGAYLDMVLCHTITTIEEVDVLYKGLETPLDPENNFGALVALRDLRDGTNHTGMNPKNERLIKHIGFSGHTNPPAMMDMIQRDEYEILDGMLVAINANDKTKMNMQHNVIPLAESKGLGIIGMKVFADAAMYGKEPRFSGTSADVFRKVGTPELPSKPLIQYALTTPGVHTVIIGIGHIDDDPSKCQLVQNFLAAQILPDGLSAEERKNIEEKTKAICPNSNYFMTFEKVKLGEPRDAKLVDDVVNWHSAIAGDNPISHYEVFVNGELVGKVEHQPQVLKKEPFLFKLKNPDGEIMIVVVDKAGNRTTTRLI